MITEVDGSVNSIAEEPKVKGKDRRRPCPGCGGIHRGVQSELNCLRKNIAYLKAWAALYEKRIDYGLGLCKTACCQNKAMYCSGCSRR